MLENIFKGVFETTAQTTINVKEFLICIAAALLIGVFLAAIYSYKSHYTKSFVITLATLPAIVCVVIMMVNGNIGAGVAVAGAFSLVRFRSVPGTAKEIGTIFLAMGTGLICGMGYIAYAVLFALILGIIMLIYNITAFGNRKKQSYERTLKIVIPEDLDYTDVFTDIFEKYTTDCETALVKTTNMGSLFKIKYNITLKKDVSEKDFIDELRCRNGNLEITVCEREAVINEL